MPLLTEHLCSLIYSETDKILVVNYFFRVLLLRFLLFQYGFFLFIFNIDARIDFVRRLQFFIDNSEAVVVADLLFDLE